MDINVIVIESAHIPQDRETLFGDEDVTMVHDTNLPTLLAELGVYKSKSEARRANRIGPIPTGWTELKASKKVRLFIWSPTE